MDEVKLSELVIKDVPEDEAVRTEIITNAMTTIANFLRRQIPVNPAAEAAEAQIEAIKGKNIITAEAIGE